MRQVADTLSVLRTIVRAAYEEDIRYPAAALAYYAFVSFVPLLLLVFAVIGDQLAIELSKTIPQFLTLEARQLVNRSIETATGRTGAGLFALAVLAWSSANVVGDIRAVIERIEGEIEYSLSRQLRDGVAILSSLGLAILAIIVTNVLFKLPPNGPLLGFVGFGVLWATLMVAFLPLYYVPSVLVTSLSEALPGALTASLGWTVLHIIIQFYTVNAGRYAMYGVLSGVIIILTSLYLAASVLLIGIVVNGKLADGSTSSDSSSPQRDG